MDQGIEVTGLHFITPFFGYNKKGEEAILSPAASIVARYSKAKERDEVEVLYGPEVDHLSRHLWVKPAVDNQIDSLRVEKL